MKYLTVSYDTSIEEIEMIYHLQHEPELSYHYPITDKQWHVKTYLSRYDFNLSRKEYRANTEGLLYNIR